MGFGKLFIGCFIAYIARIGLGDYGSAAILTGYVVMLWGLYRSESTKKRSFIRF